MVETSPAADTAVTGDGDSSSIFLLPLFSFFPRKRMGKEKGGGREGPVGRLRKRKGLSFQAKAEKWAGKREKGEETKQGRLKNSIPARL